MDENQKPWYLSSTILGALAVVISVALQALIPDITSQEVLDVLLKLAEVIGGVVAIWGRIRASKRIIPSLSGRRAA